MSPRLICRLISLALLSSAGVVAVAAAAAGGTHPAGESFDALHRRWAEARDKERTLQSETAAADPALARFLKQQDALNAAYKERTQRRLVAGGYLQQQAKKDPEAAKRYARLRNQWTYAVMADLAKDAESAELLRVVVTHDPVLMKQWVGELSRGNPDAAGERLDDPEVFWKVFRAKLLEGEAAVRTRFDALAAKSGFPEFVVAQAKEDARHDTLTEYIKAYERARTPAALREAKEAVRDLEAKMTALHPDWRRAVPAPAAPGGRTR